MGQDECFPKGAEAMKQGDSRLERGCGAAREPAKEKGWPFRWGLAEAPDMPHDAAQMFRHPQCRTALTGRGE